MAVFALWLVFWAVGGAFGPVQYHPGTPADSYHEVEHDSGAGR
jgi:hypothetical protein